MKIYIAERCYEYDDFVIIGVFSSKKLAQKAIDKDKKKSYLNDGWDIEEFELDKEKK